MARKVFFSFHYKRDAWRAANVRSSDLLADEDEYGVIDSVEWEKLERDGPAAIARWINDQLNYTSVTVVLIGAETAERDWVDYEIRRSWERGNALVGVRIHGIRDQKGNADYPGIDPLDGVLVRDGTPLSQIFRTYDWVTGNGRTNLGQWVEEAFRIREAYFGEIALRSAASATAPIVPSETSVSSPTVIQNPARPWSILC